MRLPLDSPLNNPLRNLRSGLCYGGFRAQFSNVIVIHDQYPHSFPLKNSLIDSVLIAPADSKISINS
jgi:hypothetical protein